MGGAPVGPSADDWPVYGHDTSSSRYSPLTDITRENVGRLKVAWTYHTGDISDGKGQRRRSGFETTPIVVDGTLYLDDRFNRVIALDPASGAERWAYDPERRPERRLRRRPHQPRRRDLARLRRAARRAVPAAGLRGDARRPASSRSTRATGQPCTDFGTGGEVSLNGGVARYHPRRLPHDLAAGRDRRPRGGRLVHRRQRPRPTCPAAWSARSTRAPARCAGSGIRFRPTTRRRPASVWRTGAANAWSILAVDRERHLVFVPTGSASPDYFGGLRLGDNKWANSVVALRVDDRRAASGASSSSTTISGITTSAPRPLLATLTQRRASASRSSFRATRPASSTCLHRDTGAPVFPVEERPVPKSDVPGEVASPTQPIPLVLPPLVAAARRRSTTVWGLTPQDKAACLAKFAGLRSEGVFTPPSLRGSVVMPGNVGGMNWSGYAFDPVAPPADRQHEQHGGEGEADPARRVRRPEGAHGKGRVLAAARHALRDVPHVPAGRIAGCRVCRRRGAS